MKIFEKILWAVDFNQNHELSVSKIKQIGDQFGNEIILLNVLPGSLKKSSFKELVEKSTVSELNQLISEFSSEKEYKISYKIAYGNVVDRIIEISEKENVNAVFLNTGKFNQKKARKLGLNTLNTIRNSRKPVVILSNNPILEKGHIVCPIDFSKPSIKALNAAILHAKISSSKLSVISVFSPLIITSPRFRELDVKAENENLLAKFKSEYDNFLNNIDFLDLKYENVLLQGDTINEIIKYARKANVLYMGSTGKSGLSRFIMGSVAEKVAQEIPCSIVITKFEEIFNIKLQSNIKDINTFFVMGNKLNDLGFHDEAIRHYEECLNINEMHIPSVKALSKIYQKLDKKELEVYFDELYSSIVEQLNSWNIPG